ncbi:MAG: XdhC family protein, partial [Pseudomonadota bacterium]
MQGADQQVLSTAVEWLDAGHRVTLVTVAKTWGSAPRPAGSLMVVRDDGRLEGSVSGGCIEDDLLARCTAGEFAQGTATLVDYGVNNAEAQRVGLPCGGRLELALEMPATAAPLRKVLEKIHARQLVRRRLCLSTGEVSLHRATRDEEFAYDGENLDKVFGPQWRMLLIGAGHLSRYVAQMALALEYEVIVCDPRREYADAWEVPGTRLETGMPDDVVAAHPGDARSIVLALTHDPKLDDMALMQALVDDTFYVGALGSTRSNAKRRERLASLGVSAAALARMHGPVGLPIGSRTPAEIAVAILSGVTAQR